MTMGNIKKYQNIVKSSTGIKRSPLLKGTPDNWLVKTSDEGSSRNRTRQRGLINLLLASSDTLKRSLNKFNIRYWVDEDAELVAFKFRSKQLSISSGQLSNNIDNEGITYDDSNIAKETTGYLCKMIKNYPKYSVELLLIYEILNLGYDGRFNRKAQTFDKHFLDDPLPEDLSKDPAIGSLLLNLR